MPSDVSYQRTDAHFKGADVKCSAKKVEKKPCTTFNLSAVDVKRKGQVGKNPGFPFTRKQ